MSASSARRTIDGDWYSGSIPENAIVDPAAYVETSFSFHLFRSTLEVGFRARRGASLYLGTMLDVGETGAVTIGEFALVNGARIICDREVTIGDYALISWNVVLMDTYRVPREAAPRRAMLEALSAHRPSRWRSEGEEPRPVTIARNVWIGFDSCVLPGVSVGEGSVIGARSVVVEDVAPYTIVAGNPARTVRRLDQPA